MEVRNCKNCGKLFNYLGNSTPFCPQCMKELEDKFTEVKQYIYDNPGANIDKVATDMEISVRQIQRWVREERLTFAEGSMVGIECESCGTMIRTGRFCATCKQKMIQNLGSAMPKNEEQVIKKDKDTSARMRFLE